MTTPTSAIAAVALVAAWLVAASASSRQAPRPEPDPPAGPAAAHPGAFLTAHDCMACHNGLTTATGEDVSIGVSWRATMMANSSRDPYWQAAVRREVLDHPGAAAHIEDECAACHMPMARTKARSEHRPGRVFAHLPVGTRGGPDDRLAADGVSCTVCHQIGPDRLGTRESFNGAFALAGPTPAGAHRIFGRFDIQAGRQTIMRSASGMTPAEGAHLGSSEVCATCHTLFTRALGPTGEVVGELPEQVPYLEWRHSAYYRERSCQSCHMPAVTQPAAIASVLGEERLGLRRHTFLGGNFFMLRMLNRYRASTGVEALPQELEAAATATIAQLQRDTATVTASAAPGEPGQLTVDVAVRNLTGHKLPTAYPSRRAWLHLTVQDRNGRTVFESGGIEPSGRIRDNDNDEDPAAFEPHHLEIASAEQVQIYEAILRDVDGKVTTGLLRGTGYLKDNRLLPRGFEKTTAPAETAVFGAARDDGDFTADGDRVRYRVATAGRSGPFRVDVELRYQPISFRWAQNLRSYDAAETNRFVTWYDAMSSGTSEVLARATLSLP